MAEEQQEVEEEVQVCCHTHREAEDWALKAQSAAIQGRRGRQPGWAELETMVI